MIDEKKIEEAANKYAINTYAFDEPVPTGYKEGIQEVFQTSINWFKDNLWHDASEEPEEGKRLLVEYTFTGKKSYAEDTKKSLYKNWQTKVNKEGITRWLYIDDLLKGGK